MTIEEILDRLEERVFGKQRGSSGRKHQTLPQSQLHKFEDVLDRLEERVFGKQGGSFGRKHQTLPQSQLHKLEDVLKVTSPKDIFVKKISQNDEVQFQIKSFIGKVSEVDVEKQKENESEHVKSERENIEIGNIKKSEEVVESEKKAKIEIVEKESCEKNARENDEDEKQESLVKNNEEVEETVDTQKRGKEKELRKFDLESSMPIVVKFLLQELLRPIFKIRGRIFFQEEEYDTNPSIMLKRKIHNLKSLILRPIFPYDPGGISKTDGKYELKIYVLSFQLG